MKKTLITLSIFFAGYYAYAMNADKGSSFEFNKYSNLYQSAPGDTTKSATDSTGDNGGYTESESSSDTQRMLDSINAVQNGGSYGGYNNYNSSQPASGTREPNSYKSGRTGGQYDAVIRPGIDPIKKKDDNSQQR